MLPRARSLTGVVGRLLPADFLFGVATADHQCEQYDGRDDIRDVWERVRGLTPRGCATKFWTRYLEDIALAAALGCKIFRISLSWARLEPAPGIWDESVVGHYRHLLQGIRDAGMRSVVTLHHNTWPVHVEAAGHGAGMMDPEFPQRLASYAGIVARRFGDLIDFYLTLNEPNQLIYGYIKSWGMRSYPMPPGLEPLASEQTQLEKVVTLIPNLFRAHALARTAIKRAHPEAMVGSNPLVLGLPRWLRWIVDAWATRVTKPGLFRQAKILSGMQILAKGRVDLSIAQLTFTQDRTSDVLFSESYFVAKLGALHRVATSLPASFEQWAGRVGVTEGTPAAGEARAYFPKATVINNLDTTTT